MGIEIGKSEFSQSINRLVSQQRKVQPTVGYHFRTHDEQKDFNDIVKTQRSNRIYYLGIIGSRVVGKCFVSSHKLSQMLRGLSADPDALDQLASDIPLLVNNKKKEDFIDVSGYIDNAPKLKVQHLIYDVDIVVVRDQTENLLPHLTMFGPRSGTEFQIWRLSPQSIISNTEESDIFYGSARIYP